MAKSYSVVGSPIDHSKSPLIHEAAYRTLGLDWTYSKNLVSSVELNSFLAHCDYDGISVTMPLKEEALALAVVASETSVLAGAANTLLRTAEGWSAFNTDIFGITQALNNVVGEKVLLLGSGATARNAIIAIQQINPNASISVKARNVAVAEQLGVEVLSGVVDCAEFETTISTLPGGVDVDSWLTGKPTGTLLDVAYAPWPSALAERWNYSGGNVVSGLEMLIWQAIAQIRLFLNGNEAMELENEVGLAQIMRQAAAKTEV